MLAASASTNFLFIFRKILSSGLGRPPPLSAASESYSPWDRLEKSYDLL